MAERHRFVVGQRVRYTAHVSGWDDALVVGNVYTVTHFACDGYIGFDGVNKEWTFKPGCFEPADTSPTADPVVEQPKVERRFAFTGLRVVALTGEYRGRSGTVTDARVMKNTCRVEFDGSEGCGVTFGLELGEHLECLLDKQARSLEDLPVAASPVRPKVDPYTAHRLEFPDDVAARNTDSEPRNIAARGRLVAALAAEHTRQADSSWLLHPKAHWSGRNSGRRAR